VLLQTSLPEPNGLADPGARKALSHRANRSAWRHFSAWAGVGVGVGSPRWGGPSVFGSPMKAGLHSDSRAVCRVTSQSPVQRSRRTGAQSLSRLGFSVPRIEIPPGTCIRSVYLAHNSAAKVLVVRTGFGRLYVKGPSGVNGDAMLLREWVGTRLAEFFGLPTFRYGLMSEPLGTSPDELVLSDESHLRHDVVFAAVEEPGVVWEGGREQLDLVGNRSAFSRLVVLDTWMRNLDRCVPLQDGRLHQNKSNVFISSNKDRGRKPQVLAIDHTHVLGDETPLEQGDASPHVEDTRIFGLFPEFVSFVSPKDIASALAALSNVDFAGMQDIVGSVPPTWGMTADRTQRLAEFLVARARYVVGRGSQPFLDALGDV